jgi:hypothetical protein
MEEIKQETKIENIPAETKSDDPKKSSSAVIAWSISGVLFIIILTLGFFILQMQNKINGLNPSKSESSTFNKTSQDEKKKQEDVNTGNKNIFKVLAPNGGEAFCLEQPNEISWNVPPEVQTVVASLDTSVTFNRIGEFPAISSVENGIGTGKALWNMKNEGGFDVSEGNVYRITLTADYKGQQIRATSDGIFSVKKCQAQAIPAETSPQNSVSICTKENSCKFRTPGSAFRCNANTIYNENGSNWCECDANCDVVIK